MRYNGNTPTADQIKDALFEVNESFCPLEEMIATSDAAFTFIRSSNVDQDLKAALDHLEKQYDVCKKLVLEQSYA